MTRVGERANKRKLIFDYIIKNAYFFEKIVFCSLSTYLWTPRIELYINPFQIYLIKIPRTRMAKVRERAYKRKLILDYIIKNPSFFFEKIVFSAWVHTFEHPGLNFTLTRSKFILLKFIVQGWQRLEKGQTKGSKFWITK